jgi:hypothetical protein
MTEKKKNVEYKSEEITTAYAHLIWAQGLIDFVLRAGFDVRSNPVETENSLVSIFSILNEYLKPTEDIMCELDMGRTVTVKSKEEATE